MKTEFNLTKEAFSKSNIEGKVHIVYPHKDHTAMNIVIKGDNINIPLMRLNKHDMRILANNILKATKPCLKPSTKQ